MFNGIGIGVHGRRGGADLRAQVIASLFGSGENGAMYDPSDLSTLYQDAAGTTPVTADGDPVGRMEDVSGNGNHATQSTAAARPVYRTDGTLHWLEFDGFDDRLNGTVPEGQRAFGAFFLAVDRGSAMSVVPAFKVTANSGPNDYFRLNHQTASRFQVQARGLSVGQSIISTLSAVNAFTANTPTVISGVYRDDSTTNYHRVNGGPSGDTSVASNRPAAQVLGTEQSFYYIGQQGSPNKLYGLAYVSNQVSDGAIALIEQLMAEKSGVTLS